MAFVLKKARRTLVATAVLWVMGVGVAAATGNTLVGPLVNTGAGTATVNILQVGTGNIISEDKSTDATKPVIVKTEGGNAVLTIQQVGVAAASGGNKLGLTAYTRNLPATVKVYQGYSDIFEDPGYVPTPGNKPALTTLPVNGNTATIRVGKSGNDGAGQAEVVLHQLSDSNVANLNFGTNDKNTTGVLTVVQKSGAGNNASVTVDHSAATSINYLLTQAGAGNVATITALNIGGPLNVTQTGDDNSMLLDVGAVGASGASITMTGDDNDAQTDHDGAGGKGAGIQLGSIAGFDLTVTGHTNLIQIDLTNASTSSIVSGLSLIGSGKALSIYGGAAGTSGTITVDNVTARGDLSISAAGGAISLTGLDLGGNSSFGTTTGGSITLADIDVASGKSLTVGAGAGTISLSDLTLTANSTFSTDSAVGSSFSFSLASAKTATADVGLNTFSLINSGSGTVASAAVVQKGAGAKTFSMTNYTDSAAVNVTQDGTSAHSATGIEFTAAAGSTFTLVQR